MRTLGDLMAEIRRFDPNNTPDKIISVDQCRVLLLNTRGATPVTLTTKTIPEMVKRDNPYYGDCFKLSRVNVMINVNYEEAVNRQRLKEGKQADFSAGPRSWGTKLNGVPPIIVHVTKTGELKSYLSTIINRTLSYEYKNSNGIILDTTDVEQYIRKSSAAHQGIQKEKVYRDYTLDNILGIVVDGVRYAIAEDAA